MPVRPRQRLHRVAGNDVRVPGDVPGEPAEGVGAVGHPPLAEAHGGRVVARVSVAQHVAVSAPRDLAEKVHDEAEVHERVLVHLHHVTRACAVLGAPLQHGGHLEAQVPVAVDKVRLNDVVVAPRLVADRREVPRLPEEKDQLDDGAEVPAVPGPSPAVQHAGPGPPHGQPVLHMEIHGRNDQQEEGASLWTLGGVDQDLGAVGVDEVFPRGEERDVGEAEVFGREVLQIQIQIQKTLLSVAIITI